MEVRNPLNNNLLYPRPPREERLPLPEADFELEGAARLTVFRCEVAFLFTDLLLTALPRCPERLLLPETLSRCFFGVAFVFLWVETRRITGFSLAPLLLIIRVLVL